MVGSVTDEGWIICIVGGAWTKGAVLKKRLVLCVNGVNVSLNSETECRPLTCTKTKRQTQTYLIPQVAPPPLPPPLPCV